MYFKIVKPEDKKNSKMSAKLNNPLKSPKSSKPQKSSKSITPVLSNGVINNGNEHTSIQNLISTEPPLSNKMTETELKKITQIPDVSTTQDVTNDYKMGNGMNDATIKLQIESDIKKIHDKISQNTSSKSEDVTIVDNPAVDKILQTQNHTNLKNIENLSTQSITCDVEENQPEKIEKIKRTTLKSINNIQEKLTEQEKPRISIDQILIPNIDLSDKLLSTPVPSTNLSTINELLSLKVFCLFSFIFDFIHMNTKTWNH